MTSLLVLGHVLGMFWSFLRLQMRSNFPCFPASGAAKRRRWIDNTPEAAYATGEPLAASRRKGAAELARLRANHPEGGIGCQLIIHRSMVYVLWSMVYGMMIWMLYVM